MEKRNKFAQPTTAQMPVLALVLWPLLAIPFSTAFFAKNTGRPFWVWFGIGCLLPVVSIIILLFLPAVNKETIQS